MAFGPALEAAGTLAGAHLPGVAHRREGVPGMLRLLRSVFRRLLGFLWNTLVTFGKMSYSVPDSSCEPATGPGPHHPERVRQDIPLSHVEKALQRQLRDIA